MTFGGGIAPGRLPFRLCARSERVFRLIPIRLAMRHSPKSRLPLPKEASLRQRNAMEPVPDVFSFFMWSLI